MIANYAQDRKDLDLLEKTKKIIHNCKKLVSDGLLSDDDNYAMLRKDIIQELMNYETYIQKSSTDLDRLKQVHPLPTRSPLFSSTIISPLPLFPFVIFSLTGLTRSVKPSKSTTAFYNNNCPRMRCISSTSNNSRYLIPPLLLP